MDRLGDDLEQLSHGIHEHPELCYKEEKAHAWLTEFLEKRGASPSEIPGATAWP